MLLRFRFSNFRSFREQQELSLIAVPTLKETHSTVIVHPPKSPDGVLPVAAIYGANASGKTNVIRALLFVTMAVGDSYRQWKPDDPIPLEPFLGGTKEQTAASTFELDFLIGGIRHSYGFRLDATAILEEWLFVYPKSKKQVWFHRWHAKTITFSAKMSGRNKAIEGLTRKNSLFLSSAAQNNHEALTPVFEWLSGLRFVVNVFGPLTIQSSFTAGLCADPSFAKNVAQFLRAADIGVVDLQVEKIPHTEDHKRMMAAIASAMSDERASKLVRERIEGVQERMSLVHQLGDKTFPLPEDEESNGTIAYLRVLGPALKALNDGAVLCIDELDASLHPLLASQLVRIFGDPSTNRKGAQLICNTHDATLLGRANLRRDQIWFTEKSADGASHLYPLTDFKPRQNENLESGYLQGRYGAIPFLDQRVFQTLIGPAHGET